MKKKNVLITAGCVIAATGLLYAALEAYVSYSFKRINFSNFA